MCCTCCTKSFHLRCTPINECEINDWSSWICPECVSIFPYHDIDYDGLTEDIKCEFRLTSSSDLDSTLNAVMLNRCFLKYPLVISLMANVLS